MLKKRFRLPNPAEKQETGVDDWVDKWGACKICQGEIPYGHAHNCVIHQMQTRIRELEREGMCRFNCRTRRAMFIIGGRYVYENWDKLARPSDTHLEQMYDNWVREQGNE